jgi:hypothetical protein
MKRLSISVDEELAQAVRASAKRHGGSVSAWMASAAEQQIRNESLGFALEAWQAEHGAFTQEELDAADRSLGFDAIQNEKAAA